MKKIFFFLLIVIAGFLAYIYYHEPFSEKYVKAKTMCELGDYNKALPTLKKAVDKFQNTSEYPDAVYWLAKCETAISPTNVERWQTVINLSTNKAEIIEGRYYLTKNSKDKINAMECFIKDYPDNQKSREFILDIAKDAEAKNDVAKKREVWQMLVDEYSDSLEAAKVIDELGDLNTAQMFSLKPLPYTIYHTVEKGEYLSTIAKKEKTFVESIKRINSLSSDRIRPGVKLKIDKSKYFLDVDISDNTLKIYRVFQGITNFVKRYSVGTGKTDNTPRGIYKINLKQKNPIWYKPGGKAIPYGSKENLLGTRWMGIDCPGFGIHGTWDPKSVGIASSAGCIRLVNKDVEEIYDIVPFGTIVNIHN
ncbi:MAG: hypothetical protein DRI44_03135 [Chlamydiae bacterium]|nr:MAG: hypothetical protein DRI44_03135 [Chlamydiota bacterium]